MIDEWKVAAHCQSKHRRRNLSPTQKACVAAEVIEKYGEAAAERHAAAVAASNQRRVGKEPTTAPGRDMETAARTAAKSAAKDMGSSERSVERARFVQKNAPVYGNGRRRDRLPIFLASKRLAPFIPKDFSVAIVRYSRLSRVDVAARHAWPARGPKAKGWGEFLEKLGINERSARDYMILAGYAEELSAEPTPSAEIPSISAAIASRRERDDERPDLPSKLKRSGA